MRIEDAKQKKARMERAIKMMIERFKYDTGADIVSISIGSDTVRNACGKVVERVITSVNVEVSL